MQATAWTRPLITDGCRVGAEGCRFDTVVGGITYILRGLDNKPLRQYFESAGVWSWKKDWVWRDGQLLATVEPSGTKYFHLDHLGTPRRITNSSRTVIASHDYYPFGEEITGSTPDGEVLKFTGHERDLRDSTKTTDDLDYMHARYHNPNLARFLTVDPAGGDPSKPQSWNRYTYVGNNPIRMVDPDGEFAWDVTSDIASAAISIRTLWKKAGHEPITWQDNVSAVVDAVGLLPGIPGGGGRVIDAAEMTNKLMDSAKGGGNIIENAVKGKAAEQVIEAADAASKTVVRTTRSGGKAVRITKADGSVIDISPQRVKEYAPNKHPSAPPGALNKVRFKDALPGSKGYKRAPTPEELEILKAAE